MRKGTYDPSRNPNYFNRMYNNSRLGMLNGNPPIKFVEMRMKQFYQYTDTQSNMIAAVLALSAITGGR
jgi:hypothetical protein